MVWNHVLQELEPEDGKLGEHLPLIGNAGRQHAIESRDPVRSDQNQLAIGLIDVSDFSPEKNFYSVKFCSREDWNRTYIDHGCGIPCNAAGVILFEPELLSIGISSV